MITDQKLGCILLIDDDPASSFLNGVIIKKVGLSAHIQVTAKAQDALDFITYSGIFESSNHVKPDLIFVDISMPDLDGWDFVEHFRRLPEEYTSDVVLVILTSSENKVDRQKALHLPEIQSYITKPLSKSKVTDLVNKFFPRQRL